eukprot:35409_1
MFTDWSSLDRTENEKELKQFEIDGLPQIGLLTFMMVVVIRRSGARQKPYKNIKCLIEKNNDNYNKKKWVFPDNCDKIYMGKAHWNDDMIFIGISNEFKDFVEGLFNKTIISIDDALGHCWLKKADFHPKLFPANLHEWQWLNVIDN